ncbi:MAG: YIEGIA domain-containing protein [Bacillota bacterium]
MGGRHPHLQRGAQGVAGVHQGDGLSGPSSRRRLTKGRDTLASQGQRQAMLHDAASILGVRRDLDSPEFAPQAKRDLKTGRVVVYVVPMDKDPEVLLELLRRSPVLESARGRARFLKSGHTGKIRPYSGRKTVGSNHPEGGLGRDHR